MRGRVGAASCGSAEGGIHMWLCRNRHTPGYDLFFGKPQRRSKSGMIVGLFGYVWLTRELLSLIL